MALQADKPSEIEYIPTVSYYVGLSNTELKQSIIVCSLTQATDTCSVSSLHPCNEWGSPAYLIYQIRLVFAALKETLLQNALKASGIL